MKLFLAAADCSKFTSMIFYGNHGYFLTSYYIHKRGFSPDWIKWYKKTSQRGGDWIMDSGLFTMMFGAGSNKTYTEKELIKYTYKYLKDLKKIKYNHYIVEMDVHKVLGLQSLKRFRAIFEKEYPLEKTIYVWHVEEKEEGFRELCVKYPYIAISIPELRIVFKGRKTLKNAVKRLISLANSINPDIKIHLLGCTQQELMEQKGYYSCDSTSWISGGRFGNGYYFEYNKLKQLPVRSVGWLEYSKQKQKDIFKKYKVKLENYVLINCIGAMAFNKLNQYINNKYYNYKIVKKMNDE